jgi:hypothetical protein
MVLGLTLIVNRLPRIEQPGQKRKSYISITSIAIVHVPIIALLPWHTKNAIATNSLIVNFYPKSTKEYDKIEEDKLNKKQDHTLANSSVLTQDKATLSFNVEVTLRDQGRVDSNGCHIIIFP